jgi:NAD(P)-dependent dehydrogenase (short-subunit alcohol dehydrogenase family)
MSEQRTVLVTGASTGIGEACAVELDRLGFQVFPGVRRQEDADRLARRMSHRTLPILADVTDAASVSAAAEKIGSVVGSRGLDGLVNNAGIVVAGPIELLPISDLRTQLEVNVLGQIAVTQAMLPLLRRAQGRLINMSSISGCIASPFLGPYAASKFALEALNDAMRIELRRWNIEVSIIEPGSVKTPIWEKALAMADNLVGKIDADSAALYHADAESFRQAFAKVADKAIPVHHVVRAVVHALTARRPRTRYRVGLDARLGVPLVKMLPDRWRDYFVKKELGLR